MHGVELILPVECENPSLNLFMELLPENSALEEILVNLEKLDEKHRDALVALEINKHHVKVRYDKSIHLRRFS